MQMWGKQWNRQCICTQALTWLFKRGIVLLRMQSDGFKGMCWITLKSGALMGTISPKATLPSAGGSLQPIPQR